MLLARWNPSASDFTLQWHAHVRWKTSVAMIYNHILYECGVRNRCQHSCHDKIISEKSKMRVVDGVSDTGELSFEFC